jgi:hypothetical protein
MTAHNAMTLVIPLDDLQAFIKASRVQMEDGINFLSQEIGYAGLGPNSATIRDATDPAPDGTDTHVRHLVFLRKWAEVPVAGFRSWVDDTLVPALAASDEVLKLRRHLFEELDITLDHPGVTMTKPVERQYQAMVEVVVGDEAAFARFVGSPSTERQRASRPGARPCTRRGCSGASPRSTTGGSRSPGAWRGRRRLIRKLGAASQTHDDVSREFLPPVDLARG